MNCLLSLNLTPLPARAPNSSSCPRSSYLTAFMVAVWCLLMASHACIAADIYAINCGGGASGSFSADSATYANGGTKYTTTNPTIDTTGVVITPH